MLFTFKQILYPLKYINIYLLILNLKKITINKKHSIYIHIITITLSSNINNNTPKLQ